MKLARFLAGQREYSEGSYKGFKSFGGPSVYFHQQCLRAAENEFLSSRHIEMLYATLVAWGMHRMGDPKVTKTKLTDWDEFRRSIVEQRAALEPFRGCRMLAVCNCSPWCRPSVTDQIRNLKQKSINML